MTLNIAALVDADQALAGAFTTPAMRIKPRSDKRPTLDQAMNAVAGVVEVAVIQHFKDELGPVLAETLETHVLVHGECPELPKQDTVTKEEYEAAYDTKDGWETALDELVEEAIAEYTPVLSQDWLGRNTIATAIHLPDGIDKFCTSLGKEYFKQVTYDTENGRQKSAVKILAEAGIASAKIEAALAVHNNPPTEKEIASMSAKASEDVEPVLAKIAAHVGKDHDIMNVYNDLYLASDDDEILAMGAAARLGITEEEVMTLQNDRLMNGPEAVQLMSDRIIEITNGGAKKPKKKAAKKKEPEAEPEAPTNEPAPEVKQPPTQTVEGIVRPDILVALKACGAKDTDMAVGMGLSRATYNNYLNAKFPFTPSPEQRAFLRNEIVIRANGILAALALLDGTEEQEVF